MRNFSFGSVRPFSIRFSLFHSFSFWFALPLSFRSVALHQSFFFTKVLFFLPLLYIHIHLFSNYLLRSHTLFISATAAIMFVLTNVLLYRCVCVCFFFCLPCLFFIHFVYSGWLMSFKLVFLLLFPQNFVAGLNFRLFCNNHSIDYFQNISIFTKKAWNTIRCESSKIRTFSRYTLGNYTISLFQIHSIPFLVFDSLNSNHLLFWNDCVKSKYVMIKKKIAEKKIPKKTMTSKQTLISCGFGPFCAAIVLWFEMCLVIFLMKIISSWLAVGRYNLLIKDVYFFIACRSG